MSEELLPYFKIMKKMFKKSSKYFGDGALRDILNVLICEAEFKKRKLRIGNKIVKLNRGDVFISIKEIELNTGFSPKVIRSRLNVLIEEETIKKVARHKKGTHWAITCYDKYQDKPKKLNEESLYWDEKENSQGNERAPEREPERAPERAPEREPERAPEREPQECTFPNKNTDVDTPNQYNQVNQLNQDHLATLGVNFEGGEKSDIPHPKDNDSPTDEFFDTQALSSPDQIDDEFPSNESFEGHNPNAEKSTMAFEPTQTDLDLDALLAKLDDKPIPDNREIQTQPTINSNKPNQDDSAIETENNTELKEKVNEATHGYNTQTDIPPPDDEYFPIEVIEPPPPESPPEKPKKKISKKVIKKKTKKKSVKSEQAKSDGSIIREVYSEAYFQRYGVKPLPPNAKTNSQFSNIAKQVGIAKGCEIVRFYLTHGHATFLDAKHDIGLCLLKLQKLNTEMQSGIITTSSKAKSMERFTDTVDTANRFLEKIEREERQEKIEKQQGILSITEGF